MFSDKYECSLRKEVLEKAVSELNEDPNTRHLEVRTLRERLEKVPGYKGRTDDGFLLRFLRCKKFDQERAFAQVITFYTLRKNNPAVFDNLTPKRVLHVLQAGIAGVLKDRAPDGSSVIVYRPGKWDPHSCSHEDMLANHFLVLSKMIEDEETQVCGVSIIADLKELGMVHVKSVSPYNSRLLMSLLQDAFPARFKGIHFVNEPTFFDIIYAIFKQIMKTKFLSRVFLYGDKMEKLHKVFPPEMLPEDYGGRLPPFTNAATTEKLVACEAQFAAENKFGLLDLTIAGKSQKKQQDATETLAGSFRKLNVD